MLYTKDFFHMESGKFTGLDLAARCPKQSIAQVEKKHTTIFFKERFGIILWIVS